MPAVVVANAGFLTLRWGSGGTPAWMNVIGILNAGNIAFTQTLANTLDTAVKAAVTSSNLVSNLAPAASLISCSIRDLRSPNQPEYVGSGAAVPGTAATESNLLPLQTALVITLRTALAGRRYRGRVYLAGYAELQNSATGTMVGTVGSVNFVTAIKSALMSNGLDMAVVSRPKPNLPVPWAGAATAVTAVVARDSVWDTQRRRAYPGI
jgi:hypothetical protein